MLVADNKLKFKSEMIFKKGLIEEEQKVYVVKKPIEVLSVKKRPRIKGDLWVDVNV